MQSVSLKALGAQIFCIRGTSRPTGTFCTLIGLFMPNRILTNFVSILADRTESYRFEIVNNRHPFRRGVKIKVRKEL